MTRPSSHPRCLTFSFILSNAFAMITKRFGESRLLLACRVGNVHSAHQTVSSMPTKLANDKSLLGITVTSRQCIASKSSAQCPSCLAGSCQVVVFSCSVVRSRLVQQACHLLRPYRHTFHRHRVHVGCNRSRQLGCTLRKMMVACLELRFHQTLLIVDRPSMLKTR